MRPSGTAGAASRVGVRADREEDAEGRAHRALRALRGLGAPGLAAPRSSHALAA